jgi:SAM-dependent methyltransferase
MTRSPNHTAAATGYQTAADTYANSRPDYPAALDHWLADTLHLRPGKSVLDLGAGTGKFTPRLLATGATVTAVEPVAAMRQRLAQDFPQIRALEGTAESIPLPDASLDAIVCAQAFHWFATAAALAEMHRVLKPGGRLGLVWNGRDMSVPWVAAIDTLLRPYEGTAPRFQSSAWRKAFPAPGFTPLEKSSFPHGHTGAPEQVIVGRQLSVSFIAALPAVEQDRLAARVRALIAATPELAGKPQVTFPYVTHAFAATRLS